MRRSFWPVVLAPLLACVTTVTPTEDLPEGETAQAGDDAPVFVYPETKTVDQVDDYHGTEVADPYRWLEDLDSAETKAWVEAQNEVTFAHFETIEGRAAIKQHLTELWDYERFGVPFEEGGRYFVSRNDGLQDQSVLYWTDDLDKDLQVLLDPNTLSDDGTVALNGYSVSPNGKHLAYATSAAGSDWQEWHVMEIESGKKLEDHLVHTKFTRAAWSKDSKGFYYGRYPAPTQGNEYEDVNYDQKLYFHKVGTPQDKDRLVYERPDHKDWQFDGEVTEDGRYLIIDVSVGTDRRNRVFYKNLKKRNAKVVELLPDFDASYGFVGNDKGTFYFRTDLDAPLGRVIAIDTNKSRAKDGTLLSKELVAQQDDAMKGVGLVGDNFIISYLRDAQSRVVVYDKAGAQVREVDFPGIGTAYGFGGDRDTKETFYGFSSFTNPGTVYRYDLQSGESSVYKQPKLAFDPERYETKQVFYRSKDGTQVPMFIVHKKGLELTGDNPTYLYGYGGFNISLTPRFSVPDIVWLEMGGVYAQPSLRGGGEYGESWHEAGTKLRKQNVFDDFIAAAEYLIAEKYTNSDKLGIGGRSNGGLLVGATLTQRPDLFGAALAGVGVMDMLRFHKFTIGWAWVSDYGSSDDPEQFKALRAYSPVHNLEAGTQYPATLIYTADHDDRVVPSHSFKFAAGIQAAQGGSDPVMIRIDTKAGHGAGKPTSKRIEEWADLWGFLAHHLDMKVEL